eukprot:SAG11_NODE_7973_length_1075_cov_1.056352_1_plen_190_part_10
MPHAATASAPVTRRALLSPRSSSLQCTEAGSGFRGTTNVMRMQSDSNRCECSQHTVGVPWRAQLVFASACLKGYWCWEWVPTSAYNAVQVDGRRWKWASSKRKESLHFVRSSRDDFRQQSRGKAVDREHLTFINVETTVADWSTKILLIHDHHSVIDLVSTRGKFSFKALNLYAPKNSHFRGVTYYPYN